MGFWNGKSKCTQCGCETEYPRGICGSCEREFYEYRDPGTNWYDKSDKDESW